MQVKIYIGTTLLDTFPNENIEITSAVTSISDITKNLTDFTRSFTVPAGANNNKLFKHYYNANIDNTFDARTKVAGYIELDGMPFKTGKFRLEKVQVKQGKPYAYTIQFWGNTINLKDKLKNDELNTLDLSAYNHTYNSANVKLGLENSLFGGDLLYSLFSKRQYYYNSNGADPVSTPTLANIAFNNGGTVGANWNDFKPSIKLLPIIEAIESKYSVVFSRDFFGRDEFKNIHLWLNETSDNEKSKTRTLINWDSGNGGDVGLSNATDTWINTSTNDVYFQYRLNITPDFGFEDVKYDIVVTNFGNEIYRKENTGDLVDDFIRVPNGAFEIKFYLQANESIQFSASVLLRRKKITIPTSTFDRQSFSSTNSLIDTFDVGLNLPKIKTLDFLKGLFQMFKLIVITKDDGTIYVNTINDYYSEGKLINLTRYVDSDNYEVERGKLLNPIIFNFQEPSTLLNEQFEMNTGQAYGDEELILEDDEGAQLDGESFDVKLPFEQIVYERLIDLVDNTNTNIMYGGVFDKTIDGVNPKPHLHYVQNQSIGVKTMAFINDAGVKEELNTNVNIPTHTFGLDEPVYSLIWGNEFNEWDGKIIENTLYSNYYESYITSVFNIKKRNFRFKGVLPLRFQLSLELNDVIQIRNNYFRFENYTFNLLTKETTLNLVNSFDNTLNGFVASRTTITTDYQAKQESIFVTNGGNFSFNKVDVGFDIDWVTVSSVGANVYFDFIQNNLISERLIHVEITNTLTLQIITIKLIQTGNTVGYTIYTADNNTITADNNIITSDNG